MTDDAKEPSAAEPTPADDATVEVARKRRPARADEKGGPQWPEPTRYGDWERKGRCIDF